MTIGKRYDLSIIIPCHDIEDYIGKCIDSILKQKTSASYEVVFVCDSCTDRTKEIIIDKMTGREFIAVDADVKSCGSARNIGLEYATGNIIWFVDGDDWIIPDDAIKTIVNEIQGHDIVHFNYDTNGYRYPDGRIIQCNEMVWQYAYTREIIGDAKFRAMQPAEDHVFQSTIFSKEPKINRIDRTIYFYNYPREKSVMWKALRGHTEENIEAR